MTHEAIIKISVLKSLPDEYPDDLLPQIQAGLRETDYKIIILDDDPTGTQTAQDLPVLTSWSVGQLQQELEGTYPAFFILTNSRSLPQDRAVTLAEEIGTNISTASERSGVRTVIISRSDSTLRGHFPAEVDANAKALGKGKLPYLIAPFFLEGGRYTINDIHYVQEGDTLVPAAQTPFAKDAAFGFSTSNLKEWVEEKTAGAIAAAQVSSVTIEDIRNGGPDRVAEVLKSVEPGSACVVNAASYRDMEVVIRGLQQGEKDGLEFLYRTAASFVRTRTGLDPDGGLLERKDLVSDSKHGGLFVIGSYVEKTSKQIRALFSQTDICTVEVDVETLLDTSQRAEEIAKITALVDGKLLDGKNTAVFTSRKLITGSDGASSLAIGNIVSDSLIEIVSGIQVQPRYLVAKGGITSSDVATKALNIRRAMVLGQPLPGVPAWKIGEETRYPGMTYIIFPGNVGDDNALVTLYNKLG